MDKLYNLKYLKEISGGEEEFIVDMLNDFVVNTPITMAEIELQAAVSNWEELHKIAHRFVSTFDFIGADDVIMKLRTLELYCKTGSNLEQIPILVRDIKLFSDKIIVEIKSDFKF